MQFGHALCCVLCSALPLVVMEDLSIWMSSELCIACWVTAIMLCCSYAVLCAVCMQLNAGLALLYYRPVCSCALVCSAACVALLCCALCCMAVLCRAVLCVCMCCLPVCVAALCELLVRRAWREALLCAALPCCALLCSAVRWNGRDMNGKQTQQKRFI